MPCNVRKDLRIRPFLSIILGSLTFVSGVSHAQVRINEAMASNVNCVADPQGEFDDWVELYNAGDTPIDLGGMYLTDDPKLPTLWQIPVGSRTATTIPPGGYALIWMDGDTGDYQAPEPSSTRQGGPPASGFHAGFRLDVGGDEIHLFAADGATLLDRLSFGEQTPDVSYGRFPDGGDTLRFFGEPTPGMQNNEGYVGEVAPLRFSHECGLYSADVTRIGNVPGFDLTISTATPGARIIYTLDGRAPNAPGYRTWPGKDYASPLRIAKTTCLRAMALKDGYKPTKIYTCTYIFDSRLQLKTLPIISLVGDAANTFYEPNGVMAVVGGTYSGGTWTPSGADSYNNFLVRGLERPVSAEWILPSGDEEFQIDCGLRVHGSGYERPRYVRQNGAWSGYGKISLRLYFRGDYGKSRLEYPLFLLSEAEQFASLVLRAGHNDRSNPFIKDELLRRLHRDMGQVACMGTFANLFVNGEYKGYYNPTEQVKEEACQEWFDSEKPWDVMTMNGIRDGNQQSWDAMIAYARNHNLSDPVFYAEMCKKLDVVCFIDYLIIRLWPNDWDWPQNNWSAACERSQSGQWKFFLWDAEATFESGQLSADRFVDPQHADQGLNVETRPNGYLYRALKANRDFRMLFADRLYKHFFNGGAMTQTNINRRFAEMQNELKSLIPNMSTYIVDTWTPSRHSIFLNACTREGLYTFAGPSLTLNSVSQFGGNANSGDLLRMASSVPGGTIYYTLDGSDPIPSNMPQMPVTTVLVARETPKRILVPTSESIGDWRSIRSFDDSQWLLSSGSPGGVGFERSSGYEDQISTNVGSQMYGINGSCYIRIPFQFSGDRNAQKIMTLKMQYDDGFVVHLNGEEVARRNFTGSPAWNSVASSSHSDDQAVLFESIDLSSHISKLRQGNNILAVHGMNAGTTSSDFLIGVELTVGQEPVSQPVIAGQVYSAPIPLTKSTRVKARVLNGSTWSALTDAVFSVGPVVQSLRISEIMFHPADDPNSEYIELTNVGGQAVNLNLARFTKGVDFTFPDLLLTPGAFCLVVKNRQAFEAKYGPGLPIVGHYVGSLSDSGERIELQNALREPILSFQYRDDWFEIADGAGCSLTLAGPTETPATRWGDRSAWRPSAVLGGSPGADDGGDVLAAGVVVVSELLANSAGVGPDWIELQNTTDQIVDIGGWFLSDDDDDLTKFQIAEGTVLPPQGFILFGEKEHFGNAGDPGCRKPFGLSATGETLYLHSGVQGTLTGYSQQSEFGATDPGVTLGRYESLTTGARLVPMIEPTPGEANAGPLVGPIVISEIMYHVDGWPNIEYVELCNVSDANVTLYDPGREAPWRFTDDSQESGIDFLFPADSPVVLGAYEYLLLVKDAPLFRNLFPVPASVQVLSWGMGRLSDTGETLQLSMPGDLDDEGSRTWIVVDRVCYSNGSQHQDFPGGVDLWSAQADGHGSSLTRVIPDQYGDDVLNWRATTPSPGTAGPNFNR